MSNINILISVSREQQIAIEEHCINFSKTPSEYLMGLHEDSKKPNNYSSSDADEESDAVKSSVKLASSLLKKSLKDPCERKKPGK